MQHRPRTPMYACSKGHWERRRGIQHQPSVNFTSIKYVHPLNHGTYRIFSCERIILHMNILHGSLLCVMNLNLISTMWNWKTTKRLFEYIVPQWRPKLICVSFKPWYMSRFQLREDYATCEYPAWFLALCDEYEIDFNYVKMKDN